MADCARAVVLIGNPGVGKTSVFEQLSDERARPRKDSGGKLLEAPLSTGSGGKAASLLRKLRARGGNGETTESVCSTAARAMIVDTPGIGLLFVKGESEEAARDLLVGGGADAVLFVADAKNPRRSLTLFLQLAEFGLPTAFVLNMIDEASSLGLEYDTAGLASALDVELIETVAADGESMERLIPLLSRVRVPTSDVQYPAAIAGAIDELAALLEGPGVPPRGLALLLLAGNHAAEGVLAERFAESVVLATQRIVRQAEGAHKMPLDVVINEVNSSQAEAIIERVTRARSAGHRWSNRLGRYASHPIWGIPFALLVLVVGYLWVGVLGAGVVVDGLDRGLFKGILLPAFERALDGIAPVLIRDALLDQNFGLLPTGLFLAIGIVLPVLFFFYVYFGVLEDSGYLPRLSVLMDRFLRLLGLNGKGVLPMVFGLSCVTMAILTTRVLKTRKERVIATFLLLLSFPCAPLLAVMLLILSSLSWKASAVIFGLLAVQTLVAGMLANTIMSKHMPDFIIELPPMRLPRPRLVLARALRQSFGFLKDALPIFLVAALFLFALDRIGTLDVVEQFSQPVVRDLLGLPDQAIQVFIKTIIRRENGAAELTVVARDFDPLQLVVTLFVMVVLVPCVNTTIVLIKEQGIKIGLAMLSFVCVYAIIVGAGLGWICRAFGVDFA